MDYLENGNIRHSVNYPDCDMGLRGDKTRILLPVHTQCTEYDRSDSPPVLPQKII